jgi:hypothetical protein
MGQVALFLNHKIVQRSSPMSTRINPSTAVDSIGYCFRLPDFKIGVTRNASIALARTISGVARICFADHCHLKKDTDVMVLGRNHLSFGTLSYVLMLTVETDEVGHFLAPGNGPTRPVDYV